MRATKKGEADSSINEKIFLAETLIIEKRKSFAGQKNLTDLFQALLKHKQAPFQFFFFTNVHGNLRARESGNWDSRIFFLKKITCAKFVIDGNR